MDESYKVKFFIEVLKRQNLKSPEKNGDFSPSGYVLGFFSKLYIIHDN